MNIAYFILQAEKKTNTILLRKRIAETLRNQIWLYKMKAPLLSHGDFPSRIIFVPSIDNLFR